MPQMHLPLFPGGATEINETLSFARTDGTVTYFQCGMPVFSHDQHDRASFRLIAAQLYVTCGAKQADIAGAFGVPQITIKRAVKQYRTEGIKGFFAPRVTRGPSVLTAEVLEQAQGHLDEGQSAPMVAERLGVKSNTLSKAIRAGRLRVPAKKKKPITRHTLPPAAT